jgi:hypothetical protein
VIRCSLAKGGTSDKMKGWIPAYAESTPRIEKKYSGDEVPSPRAPLALKNTSHLGQKDARDKRARGGNDGLTILSSSRMRGPMQ